MNQGLGLTPSPSHPRRAVWLAFLAGLVMSSGVVAAWYVINDRAHEHIGLSIEHSAQMNELLVQQDIDNRLSALERLGQRWPTTGQEARGAWEADAEHYVKDMPGLQAIEWADSSFKFQWIAPPVGGGDEPSADLDQLQQVEEVLAGIRETEGAVLTRPFELSNGGLGIAAFVPVNRDGRFDGVIGGGSAS